MNSNLSKVRDKLQLMTLHHAAKTFNVHRNTLLYWIKIGKIDSFRLDPKIYVVSGKELEEKLRSYKI